MINSKIPPPPKKQRVDDYIVKNVARRPNMVPSQNGWSKIINSEKSDHSVPSTIVDLVPMTATRSGSLNNEMTYHFESRFYPPPQKKAYVYIYIYIYCR